VFEKSLRYPPNVTDECWYGLYVLARLVYFFLGACTIIAETVNTILVLPALLGTTQAVNLPGNVEAASGTLIIAVPALFGCIVLECVGLIPYGARLFPHLGKVTRWILGSVAFLCLVGSILVIGDLYVFRGAYITNPDSTTDMTIPILGGLGLLIAAVAVFALWAVVVGLVGVSSVVFWLAATACKGFAQSISLLPALFDVLAVHLSGGERTVYESYLPGLPYQVPNTWFNRRSSLSPVRKDQQVSSASVQEDQASTSGFPISSHTENEVLQMTDGFVGITLNGVLGHHLLQCIQLYFSSCKKLVRCSGRVAMNSTLRAIGLGVDVSAATYDLMGNKLIEAFLGVPSPFLMHVLDCQNGLSAIQMLRDVKRRLPQSTHVVITTVSASDLLDSSVQAFLQELETLHTEGILATTLIVRTDSALVRSQGEVKVYQYVARFLADLVVAPTQSSNNLSAPTVANQLRHVSPFVSLAFATAPVDSGQTKTRWFWLKPFTKKAVMGNLLAVSYWRVLPLSGDPACCGGQTTISQRGDREIRCICGSPC